MEGSELLKSLTSEDRREILALLRLGEIMYGVDDDPPSENASSIKEHASTDEK